MWAILTECALLLSRIDVESADHSRVKSCFDALRCLFTRLLPCEPCRLYYAHAWSVLEDPHDVRSSAIVPGVCSWVHAMHNSVSHKVAGAEGQILPNPDVAPNAPEWYRRLLAQGASGVGAEIIMDAFLYMAMQIECDSAVPGQAQTRCACYLMAFKCCAEMLGHESVCPSVRRIGFAMRLAIKALRQWRVRFPHALHTRNTSHQIATCAALAMLARQIHCGGSAADIYKECDRKMSASRGSLSDWVAFHAAR